MTTKKKFNTFHDFVLKDENTVVKVLLVLSSWLGPIVFSLITYSLFASENYVLAVIFGLFTLAGWYKLVKFYRYGGANAVPKISSEQFVWRRKNGKRTTK
jgi:hypothetical protein